MDYRRMDFQKVIDRINELYKKSQEEGLTEKEIEEQKAIRSYYISVIKGNCRNQLDGVRPPSGPRQ